MKKTYFIIAAIVGAGALLLFSRKTKAQSYFLPVEDGATVIVPAKITLPNIPVTTTAYTLATRPTVFPDGTRDEVKTAVAAAVAAETYTARQQEAIEKLYAPLYMADPEHPNVVEFSSPAAAHLALAAYFRNFPQTVAAAQSADAAVAAEATAQLEALEARAVAHEAQAAAEQNIADEALWEEYLARDAEAQQATYEASVAAGDAAWAAILAGQVANAENTAPTGFGGGSVPVEDLAALGYPV